DRPPAAVLVEVGAGDGGGELDVLAQVEPVGDVVQPALDLGLTGELLAPAPVLVELLVEVVLVDVGLAVEPRPRAAVRPPGAANVARLVDRAHPQPLLAQLVELVQPGDPGPEYDGVQLFGGGRCGRHRRSFVCLVSVDTGCEGASRVRPTRVGSRIGRETDGPLHANYRQSEPIRAGG